MAGLWQCFSHITQKEKAMDLNGELLIAGELPALARRSLSDSLSEESRFLRPMAQPARRGLISHRFFVLAGGKTESGTSCFKANHDVKNAGLVTWRFDFG